MSESPSSTPESNPQKMLIGTDMTGVPHLMQPSDEDTKNSSKINNNNKRNKDEDEKFDDHRPKEINSEKIEEISGEEETHLPLKKQKHRSLVSIYLATKPMNARYGN